MGEGVAHLCPRIAPVGRQRRAAALPRPSRSPANPACPPSRPRSARVSSSQAPSSRRAIQTVPCRTGLASFAALRGSSACTPAARAAQSCHQGQIPQAGLRGVQIVAPRSITAWA